MQKIVNRIVELTEFLEYAKKRCSVYLQNMKNSNMFPRLVERYKKDVYFNQKAQHRIKKALKRETIKLYELLND